MAKNLKVELGEMYGADADWLSLVTAGANRQPIKVMKDEEGAMSLNLDLKRIFKLEDAAAEAKKAEEAAAPRVLAVIATKADDVAKARIEAAGFSTENPVEQDGATVFKQEAEAHEGGDQIVFKVDDTMAALISVQKGLDSFPMSSDFGTNLAGMGFFPSVAIGMDAFAESVHASVFGADGPAEAGEMVQKAASDFGGFVAQLVRDLPETVFKLDLRSEAQKGTVKKFDITVRVSGPDFMVGDGGVEPSAAEAEFSSGDGVDTSGRSGVNKDELTEEQATALKTAETVLKAAGFSIDLGAALAERDAEDAEPEEIKAARALLAQHETQKAADAAGEGEEAEEGGKKKKPAVAAKAEDEGEPPWMAGFEERIGSLTQGVENAVKKADEALRAATGAVVGGDPEVDVVTKEEEARSAYGPPLLDTAMSRGPVV